MVLSQALEGVEDTLDAEATSFLLAADTSVFNEAVWDAKATEPWLKTLLLAELKQGGAEATSQGVLLDGDHEFGSGEALGEQRLIQGFHEARVDH